MEKYSEMDIIKANQRKGADNMLLGELGQPCNHSWAWSGKMPCTGIYRCVLCGADGTEAEKIYQHYRRIVPIINRANELLKSIHSDYQLTDWFKIESDFWADIVKGLRGYDKLSISDKDVLADYCGLFKNHPERMFYMPPTSTNNIYFVLNWLNSEDRINNLINSGVRYAAECKFNSGDDTRTYTLDEKYHKIGYLAEFPDFSQKFRIRRSNQVTDFFNALVVLDGKSLNDIDLFTEINKILETGFAFGETDYFEFHCYKNGNIKFTWKKPELIKEMKERFRAINKDKKGIVLV